MPKVRKVIKEPMPVPEEGFKVCFKCFFENPDPAYCVHPLDDFLAPPNDSMCKRHYYKMQYTSRQSSAVKKRAAGDDPEGAPYGGKTRPKEVPDGWVYASKAASLWGVSREWVRQLIERNEVQHMKVNGRAWLNPESYSKEKEKDG